MTLLATSADITIDWWAIGIGLAGGLALFLFGLEQMTEALKAVAGEGLRTVLGKLTKNRFTAALTGAFVTSVIQSSSVTTVLVVGFISAGLMSLQQSVGVIMGANIGTTVTAQIIAFKVTKLAMLLIVGGFAVMFVSRGVRWRQCGQAVMGLGLVFFGMNLMSEATGPLRGYQPFIDLMARMDNVWLAIAAAAIFTAVVQSSSATTGIVIVLATGGFIDLESGIALAMGANIGTCVTAMLATMGKPRAAVQAALVHVLFNVLGVLIWVGLIGTLADFVRAASLEAGAARQIANAHTVFNAVNTVLFIGFTGPIARLVQVMVPPRPEPVTVQIEPKYLDPVYLESAGLAFDRVLLELNRMGAMVMHVLSRSRRVLFSGEDNGIDTMEEMEEDIDTLHGHIIAYLGHIDQSKLTEDETAELTALIGIANDLEAIGDLVETNLLVLGRQRVRQGLVISEQTVDRIEPLSEAVREALQLTLDALAHRDAVAARRVVGMKKDINARVDELAAHLTRRMAADEPDRVATYRLETECVEQIKRSYYFTKRIARAIERRWGESEDKK